MKTVIIAPTLQRAKAIAAEKGVSVHDTRNVVVAYDVEHLLGYDLRRNATVYMAGPGAWGGRLYQVELEMRLKQAAEARGAEIRWVN